MSGTEPLSLNGANTYAGGTTINSGAVALGNSALGSTNTTVNNT